MKKRWILALLVLWAVCLPIHALTAETVLEADTPTQVEVGQFEKVMFQFVPAYTETYTFYSENGFCTYGRIYNYDHSLDVEDIYSGEDANFTLTCTLEAGVTYYLETGFYNDFNEGSFTVTLRTDHSYEETVITPSNCYEEGLKHCVCTICGYETDMPVEIVHQMDEEDICTICGAGYCGDDMTWRVEDGVLTIYGTGAMWDFNAFGTTNWCDRIMQPWFMYTEEITRLEISEGVTVIGCAAFANCSQLTEVIIPEGVEVIGEEAFYGCTSLIAVEFPASVETLCCTFASLEGMRYVRFEGDAPSLYYNTCSFPYNSDTFVILYHSSCNGWEKAMDWWEVSESTVWLDLDSLAEQEPFAIEKEEYTINLGESLTVQHNADVYTRLFLEYSVDDGDVLLLTKDGTVSAIRPGSAVLTIRTEDGTVSDSCRITVETGTVAESRVQALEGKFQPNEGENNYSRWDSPKASFLTVTDQGGLERIHLGENGLVVSCYGSDLKLRKEFDIALELPTFGGFFSGESYNFLVFGQDNPEESSDVEVLRIVKYSKDWVRMGESSVYGANTTIPFRAGTADMAEAEGYLYLHTCHQMYRSNDGLNHQASMSYVVEQDTMELAGAGYLVSNNHAYVSHSFSQRVRTNGIDVFWADHGDGYPRAVCLAKSDVGRYLKPDADTNLYWIQGELGDNTTGVSLGGLELSAENCLVVGSSVDQSSYEAWRAAETENIFLTVTDQNLQNTETIWLTDLKEGSYVNCGTPQLVKVADNIFLVLWDQIADYTVSNVVVTLVDGNGRMLCEPLGLHARLSDCQPIVTEDGLVTWYTASYEGENRLYQLGWKQLLTDPDAVAAALGHKMKEIPGKEASYIDGGVMKHYQCTVCEKLFADRLGDKQVDQNDVKIPAAYSCTGSGDCPVRAFTDVGSNDWFHLAVDYAVDNGLMNGVGGAQFAPNGECNRAMLVTILWRLEGSPKPNASATPFTDLKDAWYQDAVRWANENSIVNGTSATTFSPGDPISREQMSAILYRYSKYKGYDVSATTKLTFPDAAKLSSYAESSMAWANAEGLITGTANNGTVYLDPQGKATRAQVATILCRYIYYFAE